MRGGDQPSRQPVCRWPLLLGLCGLLSVQTVAAKRTTERQADRGARSDGGLVYPLYVYPTKAALAGVYRDVISVASIARVAVIVNPDNGDQAACPPNADWAAAIALLRHPNITTLGYVHSAYGKRPLTQVLVLSCAVCARHTLIVCVCALRSTRARLRRTRTAGAWAAYLSTKRPQAHPRSRITQRSQRPSVHRSGTPGTPSYLSASVSVSV